MNSHQMDDFFSAMKENIDSEISKILERAQTEIVEIQEKNQKRIAKLQDEHKSLIKSRSLFDSFHRELSTRQLSWTSNLNNHKGELLEKLFKELQKEFKVIENNSDAYKILKKLFEEIKDHVGSDFEVHISKSLDPGRFKSITGLNSRIIADLNQTGILVKRLDVPISIENTLEARLTKIKNDLAIRATQKLWDDVDQNAWEIRHLLNQLNKSVFTE